MKRKFVIQTILLLLLFICVGCNHSTIEDVVILYTNDVHTYIDGGISYSDVASLKSKYENVLLLDAGDHIQGTAYGSMDEGKTIVKLMNEAGYDAATLGNHEFDYGMDGCLQTIKAAEYEYLSCNFQNIEDGTPKDNVLESYKIFKLGNMKIAVIGITTPETLISSTPAYFQDENGNFIYGIAGGNDGQELYNAVQKSIDAVKNKVDFVIALGHLGIDVSSNPWRSVDVIANTDGLDAFIDGHSHSTVPMMEVLDKKGNKVILTQTGEYFNTIGEMTISDNKITSKLLSEADLEGLTPNQEVKAIEDNWITEIDTKLGEIIGKSNVVLDNYDSDGNRLVRNQETNSGDFVADALYYLFDDMGMDVDVAFMNAGGIRNKAITGDISYKTCKEIHTFNNVACLQKVTGQQLLDALEWGARNVEKEESGAFLQVSGLNYKINTSISESIPKDENGAWNGQPTGKYRVYDVKVYNRKTNSWESLDVNKTYNLAGYNYTLRDLGDGYTMFDGAINILDYVMEDYMVVANYVKGFDNNLIEDSNSPLLKKYSNFNISYKTINGSNRIIITDENK